jgi:HAD superfamily hydrolase (TIGR01549 family)
VLDVGETLVDETRAFSVWADVLGIPRFTLMAVLGGTVAADASGVWHDFFRVLGIEDWRSRAAEVEARFGGLQPVDLYPDALPTIDRLRHLGYGIAVVANQPARRHAELEAAGVRADVMAMSEALGVAKPDAAFFERVLEMIGSPSPADVAYVGDRIDNDVLPSAAAGMRPVWIRRGPWGYLQRDELGSAVLEVRSLDELAERIDEAWPAISLPDAARRR